MTGEACFTWGVMGERCRERVQGKGRGGANTQHLMSHVRQPSFQPEGSEAPLGALRQVDDVRANRHAHVQTTYAPDASIFSPTHLPARPSIYTLSQSHTLFSAPGGGGALGKSSAVSQQKL